MKRYRRGEERGFYAMVDVDRVFLIEYPTAVQELLFRKAASLINDNVIEHITKYSIEEIPREVYTPLRDSIRYRILVRGIIFDKQVLKRLKLAAENQARLDAEEETWNR